MPDANAGVRLAQLQAAGLHQFLAMVRFPQGWQRLRVGHYAVDEEFFVLEGDLHVNGLCWQRQQHGFVPAHTLRSDTHSEGGCTAYARFYGRPHWIRGRAARAPEGAIACTADWRQIPASACTDTIRARLLHGGTSTSTWLLDAWPAAGMALDAETIDVLSLDTCVHSRAAGCASPTVPAGPVLLHRAGASVAAALH